ncbi:MAG: hypothetical protein IPN42_05370 [Methylococcaceae bacterium]|nr:hypothetical protein [Methylococcaceae bacterium]
MGCRCAGCSLALANLRYGLEQTTIVKGLYGLQAKESSLKNTIGSHKCCHPTRNPPLQTEQKKHEEMDKN